MARVTITIEVEADDLPAAVQQALGALTLVPAANGTAAAPSTWKGWSREELVSKMWAHMNEVTARALLAELSTQPAGYPAKELDAKLQMTWNERAGRLSSIGFALNAIGVPKRESPVIRDKSFGGGNWIYKMSGEDAAIIRKLAENEGLQ